MLRTSLLLFAASLAVLGCATNYQASGFTGGFTETQLADDVWTIRFAGNGFTGSGRVRDFALLRASELTLDNGYRYFVVQDEDDYEKPYMTMTDGYGYGGSKPRSERTIRCYKDKPQTSAMVYDAQFLANSLRKKYKL